MTELEQNLYVEELYRDEKKSVARMVLRGVGRRAINHLSETTYETLCGSGIMDVDGEIYELYQGNLAITVKPGTPYYDQGDVVLLATSRPPFQPDKVEYL